MMSNKLQKSSEELEQTLAAQLEVLKKESEELLKVGAVIAVGALLTYGIVRVTRKKKTRKTDQAMAVLKKEGLLDEEIKMRLSKPRESKFWPSFTQRMMILGLALAKDKIFQEIFSPSSETKESERGK